MLPASVGAISLEQAIRENVEPGAVIHTDEFAGYKRVGSSYSHRTVNHARGEYSRNGVTTNSIESVFAVLKRGLRGVYQSRQQETLRSVCR